VTNPANSAFSTRSRAIVYWITTVLLVFELCLGGLWDVLQVHQVREVIQRLGYPPYFLIILGTWKLLGGVALAAPRLPQLKEWAYAGAVFDLTGALASHLASGFKDTGAFLYLIVFTTVAFASWALRPSDRRLQTRADSA
jgi:DoxX-like family